MLHVIWKGKGWIVFVVTFLTSLAAELATRSITNDEHFYQNNPYPFSCSLIVSSVLIMSLSR
jgi:uncharacterized membrane protein YjjP (DUF1212 family)